MNPKNYVKKQIIDFPLLYATKNKDISKFLVYDQLFNVIGSGFDTAEDLYEEIISTSTPEYVKKSNIEPLFDSNNKDKELVLGYSEKYDSGMFPTPIPNSFVGVMTKEEVQKNPKIVVSDRINEKIELCPYPNFSKRHSVLWNNDLSFLSKAWLEEMRWFYSECENFFLDQDLVHNYSKFYPKDSDKNAWNALINSYESGFKRIINPSDSQEKQWQAISEAYGVEYKGNTHNFIKERGKKDRKKNIIFIHESLDKILDLIDEKRKYRNQNKIR